MPGSSCHPLAPVASPGRTAVLWGREEPPVQDSDASRLHTLQRSLCASPASREPWEPSRSRSASLRGLDSELEDRLPASPC